MNFFFFFFLSSRSYDRKRDIPSRFVGEQRAADSPETAFIVSFLSALLHPADDRALYTVLQSPVYKVPETDLSLITAAHVKNRKRLRTVLEELQAATAGGDAGTVSKEGVTAVSSLLADVVKYGLALNTPLTHTDTRRCFR